MEGEFTGETIATIVVVPLALLLSVVLFVLLRSLARRAAAKSAASAGSKWATDWDADDARLARRWSWSAPVIAVLIVVATWWGMYPWRYEYHHWVPKAGEVSTVDSRLTGTGNGAMEDKFVVKFSGDSQQYGVLDTRAAGIKPGDHLTITCVRRWQWSGTHGYDCNFVALEKDGKR
jgi:hypothetical protein